MAIAGMTRYDRRMKVAISLPDEVLERLDSAAESAGLNRLFAVWVGIMG